MLPTQYEPVLIPEAHPRSNWKTATAVVLLAAFISVLFVPSGAAGAEDAASSGGSNDTGIKVAAWAVTVPYIIAKGAFALGGAIVGGLGYLFSGLSYDTASAVWKPSIYGTYIIRPAHL